jgi:hypothetical protein
MSEHKGNTLNDDQIKILALLAAKRLMPPISYRRFSGQP